MNNSRVHLIFTNHGLRKGPPPPADLYIDARSCADPTSANYKRREPDAELIAHNLYDMLTGIDTGEDKKVQRWIEKESPQSFASFMMQVEAAMERIPSRRRGEKDPYAKPFVVCCLCAWGIHRSRATKHILAERFSAESYGDKVRKVEVR